MKKKPVIIISLVLGLAVLVGGAWLLFANGIFGGASAQGGEVYVESVAQITGMGYVGISSPFSGVIEPQQEIKVKKDTSKKLAELFVEVGQEVKAGEPLFSYDVEDIQLSLDTANLELEGISNRIKTLNSQISELKKSRDSAPESEKLSYTLQIQSAELEIATEEYNTKQKTAEIEKIQQSLQNTQVLSEIDGVIKSINENTFDNDMDSAYITILGTGNYRVRGIVSELNINSLSVGAAVTVRSRTDSSKTWSGTIEIIDRESTLQNNNDTMVYYNGMSSDNSEGSSKYKFYVALDSFDGLILGQHVYIELGDSESTDIKEGLWLPSYYIINEESGAFVYAQAKNGKIEKRSVTLGEYDSDTDTYEITQGISTEDYIAFPEEGIEGKKATTEVVVPEGGDIPEDNMLPEMNGGAVADGAEPAAEDSNNIAIIGGSDDSEVAVKAE